MCGIGGFSLSNKSNLNSRKLANTMLALLEERGTQASGAAWHSRSSVGYTKRDVRGSALNLRSMPRKTDAVILHTRYATHGTIRNMANNHPVASPDGTTHLVHNGVIYNHDMVRAELPFELPEVDTAVIPAVLQKSGLSGLSKLDGDASIAWLSDNATGILRLARVSHSPLVIAQIKDGSFFFASTPAILDKFLKRMGLKSTFELVMPERTGYAVKNGTIIETLSIPELDPAYEQKLSYSSYGNYRNMTAGGHKSNSYAPKGLWWDDSPASCDIEPASEVESDFEQWLSDNYLEQHGEFFDLDGYFVGDRHTMLQYFETTRYNEWWYEKTSLEHI